MLAGTRVKWLKSDNRDKPSKFNAAEVTYNNVEKQRINKRWYSIERTERRHTKKLWMLRWQSFKRKKSTYLRICYEEWKWWNNGIDVYIYSGMHGVEACNCEQWPDLKVGFKIQSEE